MERRLTSAMERADGLVQVSASTAELIEQVLATVGVIASQRNVDLKGASELTATIRSPANRWPMRRERLANVQRTLAEIRQKRDVDVNLEQIAKLSLGIVAKLDVVQEQLAAFRGRLDETRTDSVNFRTGSGMGFRRSVADPAPDRLGRCRPVLPPAPGLADFAAGYFPRLRCLQTQTRDD